MTRFTLIKMYPDQSRHVAHVPHNEIDQYRTKFDEDDGDYGYWLILPLEPAENPD